MACWTRKLCLASIPPAFYLTLEKMTLILTKVNLSVALDPPISGYWEISDWTLCCPITQNFFVLLYFFYQWCYWIEFKTSSCFRNTDLESWDGSSPTSAISQPFSLWALYWVAFVISMFMCFLFQSTSVTRTRTIPWQLGVGLASSRVICTREYT